MACYVYEYRYIKEIMPHPLWIPLLISFRVAWHVRIANYWFWIPIHPNTNASLGQKRATVQLKGAQSCRSNSKQHLEFWTPRWNWKLPLAKYQMQFQLLPLIAVSASADVCCHTVDSENIIYPIQQTSVLTRLCWTEAKYPKGGGGKTRPSSL